MLEFKKIQYNTELKYCFEIRKKVFILEQNVLPHEEYDEFEKESKHFIVLKEKIPIATSRIRYTKNGMKLERVAVLKEFRDQKVGTFLLKEILKIFHESKEKVCYLNSQLDKVFFYEKFGFIKFGEIFLDANIKHIQMKLQKL